MRILLYTGYRTGSHSLGEWLATELNFKYYHEPFNKMNEYSMKVFNNFSIEESDNCIIKISPSDGFDFETLKSLFDKVIVLYRENTLEQAESMAWSRYKEIYHHEYINNVLTYAHYTLSEDWLKENSEKINELKSHLDIQNNILKELQGCSILTYDELYYSNTGLKKLEDYIGFIAKSKFNKVNKLRNGKLQRPLF